MSGIYKIQNKVNGKFYIGQTTKSFEDRWDEHRKDLNGDRHHNLHLQRSWKKYGEEAFEFSAWLETCPDENVLNFWEKAAIGDDYNDRSRCYNLKEGGGNGRHSEETKKKMSEILTGRKRSEEAKKNMSKVKLGENNPFWGKTLNEEHKQKLSDALKGKPHPKITCPWCGKTGGVSAMKRHHMDNCKHKEIPCLSNQVPQTRLFPRTSDS